jgi:hypothetical protein
VLAPLGILVDLGLRVGDVDRPPIEDGPPGGRPSGQRRALTDGMTVDRPVVHRYAQPIPVRLEDGSVEGVAEARRARRHGGEHRPDFCRRTSDDPQNLTGSRLALQGLSESMLQLHIGWIWHIALGCPLDGRATFKAELGVRRVVLLAPGTLHRLLPTRRARLRSGDDSAGAWGGSNSGAGARGPVYLPGSVISASAFSSQYVMPISRYIVVAVARCSWACSRLSVRQ